jgi:two-component system LytT family response regulator
VQLVAECTHGEEAAEALEKYRPDLAFLDIQMPVMDGFQVLGSIPAATMPLVIFTTAYDQYAVRAFEARALDYLVKPFDQDRFHAAVERAREEMLRSGDGSLTRHLLALLEGPRPGPEIDQRFVLKIGGRSVFLDMDEIDWVEAAANYVKFHVGSDCYATREGIGLIAAKLDPRRFVRIHRSTIVNVRKIKELQPCNGNEYMVVLRDGKQLSCSRGYRAPLQRLMGAGLVNGRGAN